MDPSRYVEVLEFAAVAHGAGTTPKGLPYVVHLSAVAMEVMLALRHESGRDEDLAVSCALLHDTVEDTAVTVQALAERFGPAVAAGVAALSKDPSLPKPDRMADSLARILRQPPEIAMVKLADRVTNLAPPPPSWTAAKIEAYREEGGRILGALGHVSPWLAGRLTDRLARYPGR
ncbi:MAG: HD domain-containing protein [Myxococcota bacterium]